MTFSLKKVKNNHFKPYFEQFLKNYKPLNNFYKNCSKKLLKLKWDSSADQLLLLIMFSNIKKFFFNYCYLITVLILFLFRSVVPKVVLIDGPYTLTAWT